MSELIFSPAMIWATIGLVFLAAELATFTFILSFFGLGAIIVSLTTWGGLTEGLNSQLLVFSISSLLMLLLLRKSARRLFAGTHDSPPDYVGEKVKVAKTIPPGGEGSVKYRGSDWFAFSETNETMNEGDTVEIVAIEGIRVKVKPVS
ncbi:MAG: NfeD family protein [Deltaproteobacteria bacterium]|nr:NfeD family protein [Deltaproteobacteria bacterium]